MLERVNELQVGQVFKNYSALCKYLDVTAKRGDNKELQIQEFNKYFTFATFDKEIVITSIGNDTCNLTRYELLSHRIELNKAYTYNEFCKLIGEEVEPICRLRDLQRLNWSRYFDMYANDYGVRVYNIYDKPIEVTNQWYIITPKAECNMTIEDIIKANIGRLEVGQTFRYFSDLMEFLDLKIDGSSGEQGLKKLCLKYINFKINTKLTKGGTPRYDSFTITEIRNKALTDKEVMQLCDGRNKEIKAIFDMPFNSVLHELSFKLGNAQLGFCNKSKASKLRDVKASNIVVDVKEINKLKSKLKHA